MAHTDYYLTLGVTRDTSMEDLKRAYRRLAVLWHPDRNPGSKMAEERFKAVAEAYAVLSNPVKRQSYNRLGAKDFKSEYSHERIFKGFTPDDMFKFFGLAEARDTLEHIFKGGAKAPVAVDDSDRLSDFFSDFGQNESESQHHSPDIIIPLMVSFKEAALGAVKKVAYNTSTGVVKVPVAIPPASTSGRRLTLRGQGPALPGCLKGDIIVTLTVSPDSDFSRSGYDIKTTLKIPAAELEVGGNPRVPTMEGSYLRLAIPAGSKSGTVFKIATRGLLRPDGGRGDFLIRVVAG